MIIGWMVISNLTREKIILLEVPDNAGVSLLETIENSLISVFQDGKVCSWDWNGLPQQQASFSVNSNYAVLLDASRLAAVTKEGEKMLSVYSLPVGEKKKEISVGWADQQVWLRISQNKNVIALIRKNASDTAEKILYEFLNVDIEKELLGIPISLDIQAASEDFIDYCVDDNNILYAVGSKNKKGRIAAVDLEKGNILWDRTYNGTLEFCSLMVSQKKNFLFAGNRDGTLYKLDAKAGDIAKKIQLLTEGESRPITNDYSVLNLAINPDGQFFVATIHPVAYFIKTDSDRIVYTCTPANKLVSRIAFSPDSQFIATSDIRAGYPVKIWKMPQTD